MSSNSVNKFTVNIPLPIKVKAIHISPKGKAFFVLRGAERRDGEENILENNGVFVQIV